MAYGEYVLSTGASLADWEPAFGRYLFESRFRGRSPILDIGPGRCWFTRQAPDSIVGLENEPDVVEHYRAEGLDIRLGSVYEMPFPDQSFQAVFCCWLLEHLAKPERAVRGDVSGTCARRLRLRDRPSARSLLKAFYDDFTQVRPFTAASWDQLAGFCEIQDAQVQYLFWTRGGRRLLQMVGRDITHRLLGAGDRWGRKIGLANRANLVFEFSR